MRVGLSIISGLTLCFALWYGWEASGFGEPMTIGEPGSGRIPLIAAGLIGGLAVLLLAEGLRGRDNSEASYPQLPRVAFMAVAGIAYAFLIPSLGYYAATPLFFLSALLLLRTRWPSAIGVTVGFTLFVFLVFDKLLRVPLP